MNNTRNKEFNFPSVWNDLLNNNWVKSVGETVMDKAQPPVNIQNLEKAFQLSILSPGFEKENFSVKVENNKLIIEGVKKDAEDMEFTRKEFKVNSFSRTFKLPENVDTKKIEGKYENGILNINLPKKIDIEKDNKEIKIL